MIVRYLFLPFIITVLFVSELSAQSAGGGTTKSGNEVSFKDIKLKELPDPTTISWQQNITLAAKLFEKGSIYNGLKYYEEALNKNPKKTDLLLTIADGYFMLRDYKSANKYYKQLAELDAQNYEALYQYALTNKYLGNYEQAKISFQQLLNNIHAITELAPMSKSAQLEMDGCDLGIQLRDSKKPRDFLVEHLDSNINQPFTDYAPFLADAGTLYFGAWVSDDVVLEGRTERYASFSRIYSAKKSGNTWSKAQPLDGAIDTLHYHSGNAAITADGKTMYYTQCFQDERQRMRCSIYKSTLENKGWTEGQKLDINEDGATTTQPAIGKNENGESVLYFASDRGKNRDMDLYCAKLNAGGFPVGVKALGSNINTTGNEMTPYYDFTTNELYFSSNGFVNIGGLDIYKVKIGNGSRNKPQHLGLPINSSVDDMYYNWNESAGTGFFVSNRSGGLGLKSETCCDDIYQFNRNIIHLAVKGTLIDADSNKAIINQSITLFNAATGAAIKNLVSADSTFFFDLQPDTKYKLSATKEGYFTSFRNFTTEGITQSDTQTFTLLFAKMVKNKAYTLNNIYYDFDKSNLSAKSKGVLDTLFTILIENPAIIIELSSHTDSKGTDKYNLELSQKRAESCVNYLIKEKGLPKQRITAKGYGETVPVAPNTNPDGSDNENGRAQNRRTEFKITGELK